MNKTSAMAAAQEHELVQLRDFTNDDLETQNSNNLETKGSFRSKVVTALRNPVNIVIIIAGGALFFTGLYMLVKALSERNVTENNSFSNFKNNNLSNLSNGMSTITYNPTDYKPRFNVTPEDIELSKTWLENVRSCPRPKLKPTTKQAYTTIPTTIPTTTPTPPPTTILSEIEKPNATGNITKEEAISRPEKNITDFNTQNITDFNIQNTYNTETNSKKCQTATDTGFTPPLENDQEIIFSPNWGKFYLSFLTIDNDYCLHERKTMCDSHSNKEECSHLFKAGKKSKILIDNGMLRSFENIHKYKDKTSKSPVLWYEYRGNYWYGSGKNIGFNRPEQKKKPNKMRTTLPPITTRSPIQMRCFGKVGILGTGIVRDYSIEALNQYNNDINVRIGKEQGFERVHYGIQNTVKTMTEKSDTISINLLIKMLGYLQLESDLYNYIDDYAGMNSICLQQANLYAKACNHDTEAKNDFLCELTYWMKREGKNYSHVLSEITRLLS